MLVNGYDLRKKNLYIDSQVHSLLNKRLKKSVTVKLHSFYMSEH